MKVLIATSPFASQSKAPLNLLKKHKFKITLASEKKIPKNLDQFEAIIAGVYNFDEETLSKFKKLKILSRVGIGYDSVDLNYLRKNNIKLTITPNLHGYTVSELILTFLLAKIRNILPFHQDLKNKKWKRKITNNLKDYKVGIMGLGVVTQKLLNFLHPFQIKEILINDIEKKNFIKKKNIKYVNKQKLFKNSDILIINIPSSKKNRNLISDKYFSIMKKNIFIVNTSRGDLINEKDLFKFLKKNKNAFAALDVFKNEPNLGQLRQLKNIIFTPHIASHTSNTRKDMELQATKNIISYLIHRKLINQVK
tara:strand:- start:452 stop:1378 length:927 start_codon:yes stop_codon:yes gene_type:complete